MPGVEIREMGEGRAAACEAILRSLPDWFGIEEAIVLYAEDIGRFPTLGAFVEGEPAGFLTIRRHFTESAEVHVMGVRREHHRRGIGRALVAAAERMLLADGVGYLSVKTLSAGHPDPHYAGTRAFYRALGFAPLEEFPRLWGSANPCLMLVKALRSG